MRTPDPRTNSHACSTESRATADAGVFCGVFVAMGTVRLDGLIPPAISTACIFKTRYRLQVGRIHAAPYSAFVVELKSIWNRPYIQFIGNSVCEKLDPIVLDLPVPVSGSGAYPEPASTSWAGRYPVHESVKQWLGGKLIGSHVISFQIASVRVWAMLKHRLTRSNYNPTITPNLRFQGAI